ncbi:MAG TPA: ABC transporter substrate-binding protein [Sphingomonas sp.]
MDFSRLCVAAAMVAAIPAGAIAQANGPIARIAAYDEAVTGVAGAHLGLAARADRFEPIVRAYYDMPLIASLVIGPGWASASAAEKAAAATALARHSAMSLARNFNSADGLRFVVDPAPVARGGSEIVKVTIGGDTLFYRMHQAGGQWRIVDVISGGVSQLALQRADLASAAAKGIPALVKRLGEIDAVK